MAEPMIDVQCLAKTYRRGPNNVSALRGVSFHVTEGTFAFIIGPSGSGKSTLLYLMGALDHPSDGDVVVAGRSLRALSSGERDHYRLNDVGFIFQSFNLMANLNALENVLVPYFPSGVSADQRRNAAELLTRIGLGDRLGHRPRELSGGEQQRVAVARALFKRPRLILADEPTGELDTRTGANLFQHLRNLSKEQRSTVIVVTHDHRYLAPGDRVITIQDGSLVKDEIV